MSCNGNFVVNIGPRSDGTIDNFYKQLLLQMGEWLNIAGEGIYESRPWEHEKDSISKYVW